MIDSNFLPYILPKSTLGDSIRNHSQIYYRKGDYDYSDLGIGLQIELPDSELYRNLPIISDDEEEQNIKRRVYDALNVLIAANVLKKNGKSVYCDEEIDLPSYFS